MVLCHIIEVTTQDAKAEKGYPKHFSEKISLELKEKASRQDLTYRRDWFKQIFGNT